MAVSAASANKSIGKMATESYWAKISMLLLAVSTVSAIIITIKPGNFPTWYQINVLGHVLSSALLLAPITCYAVIHFKRSIGIRNLSLLLTGLLSCLFLAAVFGSGFFIAAQGHMEKYQWIATLHWSAGYLLIIVTALHIVSFVLFKRKKNKSRQQPVFVTLDRRLIRNIIVISSLYGASILSLTALYNAFDDKPVPSRQGYLYDYGDHPFRPSQTETVTGGFVAAAQIAKSHQCGGCHQDIYQQWLSSVHRQAASDPAYVKNVNLLEANRGISATRYCEGCHAPVALLTGELTPGGKHGGVPETPAHLEGVGCLGCHGIDRVAHTNGVASYVFSAKEHYLFDSHSDYLPQKIRNFLVRISPGPHKQAMGSALLQEPALCATCHEQFMDASMNDWGWVKMQSEYNDWLESAFSGQDDQSFQTKTTLTCQDCHFALVPGDDPSADDNGYIHSHRSPGANTVLPFLNSDDTQLNKTIQFLQNAKLLVSIEQPRRQDAIFNQQPIDQSLRPADQDNTPFFVYLGESTAIKVAVTNRMVGHNFPGGTIDINQAWLYLDVVDANGDLVYRSGFLDENQQLDQSAHIYHAIPVDRHGKEVWKHDLFRMVGDAYKNVIPAGKTDIKTFTFTAPDWAKNPLTVTAILKYRKFNQRYARWALDHPNPVLPVVDMARDSLTIPIKIQPAVE